ncbi:cyclin-T1 [Centruroides vittatus]|uniref:cyclin-T1 n=1 Tax=Centruroides vittatus TaxID=120091 RepID=UPI00350F3325
MDSLTFEWLNAENDFFTAAHSVYGAVSMAAADRWYFSKEELSNSPSRKCGIDADKELSYRQQAANFIQDMGQRLQVTQLCINTAIVYMHRFYVFHSFSKFHRNAIATCALFLAAKVEEQPRKLEHVIRIAHLCLHRDTPPMDPKSEAYMEQAHELVGNENIMLQTLGFDIAIEHPHTYVVKCCQLVRASKDLAQTSYIMATNSLHLTTMSLQYKPTVVACVCIHLACKWSSWELPCSNEGKEWFWYVDKSVTLELLEELTSEFLLILDKCPSRLKRKITTGSVKDLQAMEKRLKNEAPCSTTAVFSHDKGQTRQDDKKLSLDSKQSSHHHKSVLSPATKESQHHSKASVVQCATTLPPPNVAVPMMQQPSPSKRSKGENPHSISLAVYKEMKEKEKEKGQLLEQKLKAQQNKTDSHNNPIQIHSVPNNKKLSKDERKSHHHQNVSDRERMKYMKQMHLKQEENSSFLNDELSSDHGTSKLTNEEILQQKIADDMRQIAMSRISDNRMDNILGDIHSDDFKLETVMSKHKEQSEVPANPHNHHDKNSSRLSSTVQQGNQHSLHSEQDTKLRHDSRHTSEIWSGFSSISQSNLFNEEHGSTTTKLNKVKHQRHRISGQIPHEDGILHDREETRRAIEDGDNSSNQKMTEIIPANYKSDNDLSKKSDSSYEKSSELQTKQDRREKHKHKHYSHNSEKINVSDQITPTSVSGGLKITIPKDKIMLSNVKSDTAQRSSSGSPPREALKIKIPKVKISNNEQSKMPSNANATNTNSGLKLVITKDKKQKYHSFSCAPQKAEREARKRERSPNETSHDKPAELSVIERPAKVAKYDQSSHVRKSHLTNDGSDIPLPPDSNKTNMHNQQFESTNKQVITNTPTMPYQMPKPNPVSQTFLPYNNQYFPSYTCYPYPTPVQLAVNATRLSQLYNRPAMPPPLPGDPPLPREPPPPPPPLPPE